MKLNELKKNDKILSSIYELVFNYGFMKALIEVGKHWIFISIPFSIGSMSLDEINSFVNDLKKINKDFNIQHIPNKNKLEALLNLNIEE